MPQDGVFVFAKHVAYVASLPTYVSLNRRAPKVPATAAIFTVAVMIALLAAARRVRMALTAKAKEDARATAATAATITATATAATAAIIAAAEHGAVKAIAAQVQAGAGAQQTRAQAGAQSQASREMESRTLDRLEIQCNANDADIDRLQDEAAKAASRAEQSEHRAKVVQRTQGREVRDLELDSDFGRVMSGRLEGQLAAERQVRLLRNERLDAALALDKERADRAELSIAMIWECLEREKVGSMISCSWRLYEH